MTGPHSRQDPTGHLGPFLAAWRATCIAEEARRLQREARRRRFAAWFLIPYAAFSAVFLVAVIHVLDQRMYGTFAALLTGWIGAVSCAWIPPVLLRRREKAEGDLP